MFILKCKIKCLTHKTEGLSHLSFRKSKDSWDWWDSWDSNNTICVTAVIGLSAVIGLTAATAVTQGIVDGSASKPALVQNTNYMVHTI